SPRSPRSFGRAVRPARQPRTRADDRTRGRALAGPAPSVCLLVAATAAAALEDGCRAVKGRRVAGGVGHRDREVDVAWDERARVDAVHDDDAGTTERRPCR